jgi:dienelactone hydrolase
MRRFLALLACALALHAGAAQAEPQQRTFKVRLGAGVEERAALVCVPQGSGPHPAVIFNHGGIVDGWGWPAAAQRGYRLDLVCEKLAAEGYLAFVPIREAIPRGKGFMSYEDAYRLIVLQAIEHVMALPEVDRTRVALAGFSMGGLASFLAAVGHKELRAVALLAPAYGYGLLGKAARDIARVEAPLLVMVEQSDSRPIHNGVAALEAAAREAGKTIRLVRYDRGGGHRLFYSVGYWWEDFAGFLRESLGRP